jgi:hypothetical protein
MKDVKEVKKRLAEESGRGWGHASKEKTAKPAT